MPPRPSPPRALFAGLASPGRTDHRPPAGRNFGGMRFPDRAPPPPGPLSLLAAELAPAAHRTSAAVETMLYALPQHLSTRRLQQQHPRVLERLAAVWRDPRSLRDVLDELMFEGGQRRQCLSFEALVELTELKEYFMRDLYAARASIWDEALGPG